MGRPWPFSCPWPLALPPEGIIKINFDGAFSGADDKYGMGVVARDCKGSFLLAGACTGWCAGSAEMVEARAVLWAMALAREHGWSHIMIEADCKMVVEALSGTRMRSFHIQTIIDNCLSFQHEFMTVSFSFCYRDCNKAAHRLAHWAGSGISDETWVNVASVWLGDVLYSDFASIDS